MGEVLQPGAMPPDWTPPDPPREEPPRWFRTGLPGGATIDPTPYDVPEGTYEIPDLGTPRSAQDALYDARAREATGSPHVIRTLACTVCGTTGIYYGREDRMPTDPRCSKHPHPPENDHPPRR